MSFFSLQDNALVLRCLIQPKASRDEIIGIQDDRLKIRITAPPVDGKANTHLIRFLSDLLDVPRTRIELLNGDTGKRKTLRIPDMTSLPAILQKFEEQTL
ncbi:MAG TPA: DUF167 family protein [Pseudomonadales bacterium]|nr:DUF167 family protein [Pseudomonadales bacterium]